MKRILTILFIWSLVIVAFGQVFGQMPNNTIEVFEDGSVKIEWDSSFIRGSETLTSEGSFSYNSVNNIPSYTLEMRHNDPTYSTDTVDAFILVSTNNLPVHTIEGKWIKYRWNRQWLMDWWSKPEDQILDINFQSLDPTYYVWDYKTKK